MGEEKLGRAKNTTLDELVTELGRLPQPSFDVLLLKVMLEGYGQSSSAEEQSKWAKLLVESKWADLLVEQSKWADLLEGNRELGNTITEFLMKHGRSQSEGSVASLLESSVSGEQPPQNELMLLSAKIEGVVAEAALAHERILKDQEEIEQLKRETRGLLANLSAA